MIRRAALPTGISAVSPLTRFPPMSGCESLMGSSVAVEAFDVSGPLLAIHVFVDFVGLVQQLANLALLGSQPIVQFTRQRSIRGSEPFHDPFFQMTFEFPANARPAERQHPIHEQMK